MSFFIQLSAFELALTIVFVCGCILCGYKTQRAWFQGEGGVTVVPRVIVGLIWPLALIALGVVSTVDIASIESEAKKPEKETGGQAETPPRADAP